MTSTKKYFKTQDEYFVIKKNSYEMYVAKCILLSSCFYFTKNIFVSIFY